MTSLDQEQIINQELRTIQNIITEKFSGIIWFTQEKIHKDLPYFQALDYLVNGALSQLVSNDITDSKNLVMAQSFGHPFFIVQFNKDEKMNQIISSLNIMSSEKLKLAPHILLLGDVHLEAEEKLKKMAPHLVFDMIAS